MSSILEMLGDFNAEKEASAFALFPAGEYKCFIESAEAKTANSGAQGIAIKLKSLQKGFENRVLFCNMWLVKKDGTQNSFGRSTLARLIQALSISDFKHESQLQGKAVIAIVTIRKDANGLDQNDVSGFQPVLAKPAPKAEDKKSEEDFEADIPF